jgi:hypothetical protein
MLNRKQLLWRLHTAEMETTYIYAGVLECPLCGAKIEYEEDAVIPHRHTCIFHGIRDGADCIKSVEIHTETCPRIPFEDMISSPDPKKVTIEFCEECGGRFMEALRGEAPHPETGN